MKLYLTKSEIKSFTVEYQKIEKYHGRPEKNIEIDILVTDEKLIKKIAHHFEYGLIIKVFVVADYQVQKFTGRIFKSRTESISNHCLFSLQVEEIK